MPTAGSDWQNFQNWVSSSQVWIFYLLLFIMLSMYPALIGFLRLARAHRLDRFPATTLWCVLGIMPFLWLAGLGYQEGWLALVGILGSISAVPLLAGVIVMRTTHKAGRLAGSLIWLGLGLVPVLLFAFVLSSIPAAAETFAIISAIPLVVGLVGLGFTKPESQLKDSLSSE